MYTAEPMSLLLFHDSAFVVSQMCGRKGCRLKISRWVLCKKILHGDDEERQSWVGYLTVGFTRVEVGTIQQLKDFSSAKIEMTMNFH